MRMIFSENRFPPRIKSGAGSFRLMLLRQALTADMARSIRQRKATFQPFRRGNARKCGSLRLSDDLVLLRILPSAPVLVSTILPQYQQNDVGFRSVFVNH